MKNLIRKSLLLGMGAISMTRDKAEKIVRELEDKGGVKSHEAKDFVDELIEKGEQERILLKEAIKREVTGLQQTMGLTTKSDLASLEERIKRIEEKLGLSATQNGPDSQNNEQSIPEFPSGE